jgi:hypothetical protein
VIHFLEKTNVFLIGIGKFWLELKTFGIENFRSKTSEIPNFRSKISGISHFIGLNTTQIYYVKTPKLPAS